MSDERPEQPAAADDESAAARPRAPGGVAGQGQRLPAAGLPASAAARAAAVPAAEPAGAAAAAPHCPNCAAPLTGRYCAACGQSADVRIPSLPQLVGEVLDGMFNLDARIWQTLGPLLVKPGALTLEYLAGRRARYVAPFRLYLVLTLVSFLVGSLASEVASQSRNAGPAGTVETISTSDGPPVPADCGFDAGTLASQPWLRQRLVTVCTRLSGEGGWERGLQSFQDRIPLLLFLTLPVYAAVLKLLYVFSGRRYAEHLFFLFHVHAFYYAVRTVADVGAIAATLWPLTATLLGYVQIAIPIYVIYYGYSALRRVYGQGRFMTALKFLLIALSYLVILALVLAGGIVYTAFTL